MNIKRILKIMVSGWIFIFLLNIYGCGPRTTTIANAKCVTEYPKTATIKDYDVVIFGEKEIKKNNWETKREPLKWIVLEKEGDNAFLFMQDGYDSHNEKIFCDDTEEIKKIKHNRMIVDKWKGLIEKESYGYSELTSDEIRKYFHPDLNYCYPGAVSLSKISYSLITAQHIDDYSQTFIRDRLYEESYYHIDSMGGIKEKWNLVADERHAVWVKYK